MLIGVPKETTPGERRVSITPANIAALTATGAEVLVESGAGDEADFSDEAYRSKGARIAAKRKDVFDADVLLTVHANVAAAEGVKKGHTLVGLADPLSARDDIDALAKRGASLFALELLPRITRAQSMDVLSSMATIAGYKAVLIAAEKLPKLFPMMVTAAGTISAAKALVIGAGVAGLQAIATSRRLGAIVTAYDVRPEAKEEVESVGARFAEIELDTKDAGDEGGYAKELGDDVYERQRALMSKLVEEADVIITTAAIPGRPAPQLISTSMVDAMASGSVIVDLAAATGGNCELTKPDTTVTHAGVSILGPTNLPASVPTHASQMYGKNITTFLSHVIEDGSLKIDLEDEIISGTLVVRDGDIVHPRVLKS